MTTNCNIIVRLGNWNSKKIREKLIRSKEINKIYK
jgi:hypothetical protein